MEVFGTKQRCDGCDMMELTGTGVLSVRTGLEP
jgi:hypothetical protein